MLESSLVRSKAFMVGLLKHSTSYGSLEMEEESHQNSRETDKVVLLLLFLTWLRKNKGFWLFIVFNRYRRCLF